MLGVVGVQRMQRIDADDVRAARAPLREQRRQIGEIAHAPVALGAYRVQLHRCAPDAAAVFDGQRAVAAPGDHDKGRFAQDSAIAQNREAMVAAARGGLQQDIAPRALDAVRASAVEHAFMAAAALLGQAPGERRVRGVDAKIQAQRPRRRLLPHYDHGRKHALQALEFGCPDRGSDFFRRAHAHAQRAEERDVARIRQGVAPAPDVVIIGGDSVHGA